MNNQQLERVINLFEFLKQYNVVKNPIISSIDKQEWHYWLDQMPTHQVIKNNIFKNVEMGQLILSVKKPLITECPEPLGDFVDWLEKGWNKPEKEAKIKKSVQKKLIECESTSEDVVKQTALNEWLVKRKKWIEVASQDKEADDLFNRLYTLYARMKKEPEAIELLLGDGHLYYEQKQCAHHPLLLQAVKLEFDAAIPEFKLYAVDKVAELYKSILSFAPEANEDLLIDAYKVFQRENISPMDKAEGNAFLNQICYALSPDGKVKASAMELEKGVSFPQIYRRPVLMLRKRNLGFGVAIDSILEDLHTNQEVPEFLGDIVGSIANLEKVENLTEIDVNGIDKKILLTKPSNREQLLVAKHLERNQAVLVQGPPGTGKTHTIANMIGHLLSEGKSILVTSYSEKALSVLKDQVVEELQSLCLSLLSTTESREELEKTLEGIHTHRSGLERSDLTKRIASLEKNRQDYMTKLDNLKEKLKQILWSEYTPVKVGHRAYSQVEVIQYIEAYKEEESWMPMPIRLGVEFPLAAQQMEELYDTNVSLNEEEEIIFDCVLPEKMLSPNELEDFLDLQKDYKTNQLEKHRIYWKSGACTCTVNQLKKLSDAITVAVGMIHTEQEWCLETIESGKQSSAKDKWINLLKSIDEVSELAMACSEQLVKYHPQIRELDETINPRPQFKMIIEKLRSGGKINKITTLLNPNMRSIINACRVNGQLPQKVEEFEALSDYYNLCQKREKLKYRWNRQMAALGAERVEHMGSHFEETCKKYRQVILQNLEWYENQWEPILDELKGYQVDVENLDDLRDFSHHKYSEIKNIKDELAIKLKEVIAYQIYRLEEERIINAKKELEEAVKKNLAYRKSETLMAIHKALKENDVNLYSKCYEKILDVQLLHGPIEKRRSLLGQLEAVAPTWAYKINNRIDSYGESVVPQNIEEVWLYHQFVEGIQQRNSESLEAIQEEMKQFEELIKTNTSQLAFNKAWLHKLIAFDKDRSQVQAIEGWKQLIIKLGAGKGKNTESLKAEARKLMPKCQSAVPVWIMPLNKVVENFNPKENKFDVVIIDEASQADVMALVALYLGKQVLIVGDNEQVSPLAIGEKSEDVERLVKEYLYDIPNHFLYSGKFSIYDLAQVAGYQPVRLKEHFRCVPEIIGYSNRMSYNGQIQPLREGSGVLIKPPIITCLVEDGEEVDNVNPKEAEAIVNAILECCQKPEYANKTFGVITLKGEKQAGVIESMLLAQMNPVEYHSRNILCGNPSHFQGDERDIIFISLVDSHDKKGTMRLTSYGIDNLYKKRYNVAMSRAKDQVWVFHSFDPEGSLKDGDIRKELLHYCMTYTSKTTEKKHLRGLSPFEKNILRYLKEAGCKVTTQWQVGSYVIDMVVHGKDQKIAILCDGDKWKEEDELEEALSQQAILERVGWRFVRLRASEFVMNKEKVLHQLLKKLEALGIETQK